MGSPVISQDDVAGVCADYWASVIGAVQIATGEPELALFMTFHLRPPHLGDENLGDERKPGDLPPFVDFGHGWYRT